MASRVARHRLAAAAALALTALTAPTAPTAVAPAFGQSAEESEYAACLKLLDHDAAAAFESALAWRDIGGGAPARHCAALALVRLGQPAEAATRLEALAADMADARPWLRAGVLAQAGQAWLTADQPERAYAAFTVALEITPEAPEIYIDRAQALAQAGAFWEAIDDLGQAIELAPGRADAYAFRASAYRYIDNLELALDDAERALALAPDDPIARLERGNIRRLQGDDAGARADWLRVLSVAPGGHAADDARTNLERLDVKTD